jgi:flagellar protein FlbD
MISLTRLNGERIAVNPDLLERAEETPDTVLTLTNGTKYVVHETLDELIERVQAYRAGTWVLAQRWAAEPDAVSDVRLHLVSSRADGGEAPDDHSAPGADAVAGDRIDHPEHRVHPEHQSRPDNPDNPDPPDHPDGAPDTRVGADTSVGTES